MAIEQTVLWHNEHLSTNAFSEPSFMVGNEVHIWTASSAALLESMLQHYRILSDEEKDKAARFRKLTDQGSYIISQGIKRFILSSYVGCHPEEIEFEYNEYGKPYLSDPNATLVFNIAHSKNIALLAVARGTEVGIDVEYINPAFDWRAIANRFFSPDELQQLNSCTEGKKASLFFSYWTHKEAILKAQGMGLFGMELVEPSNWRTVPFQLADNYMGSLAISQTINSIRVYTYGAGLRLYV